MSGTPPSAPGEPEEGEPDDPKPEPESLVSVYLKGVAMGAADAVPGVSGGTIALPWVRPTRSRGSLGGRSP
jgi:putative membrane protein